MRKSILLVLTLLVALSAAESGVSARRIREHTRFLSSDLLEGRGVGQRGGDIATEYIATQLALAGAQPAGDNGTYFQNVPLVGVETAARRHAVRRRRTAGKWPSTGSTNSSASARSSSPMTRFEADAVFVGHGITAPEYNWDDFKGVDVAGKVLVLFTNEPPSNDPKFFDGRALTYYGRWTYKYEEALRRGARARPHHPHHSDRQLRLGRGAQLLGPRDAVRETRPRRERRSPCRLDQREAGEKLLALAGKTVDRTAGRRGKARFQAHRSRHPHPRRPAFESPRDRDPQRGRHGARQRSQAEDRKR